MGSHGGHFQGSLFGHPVQVVHGLAAADCLNSRKHHAYALWGWASPHSRVSTPRARCLLLPAMWVTCRFNWPFGTRSHRGRVFTDVSRIPFCRHTLENTCQQQNEMQLISNRKVQTISSRKCAFSPAENVVIQQSMPPLPTSSRSLAKSILRCTFFRAPGQVYQDLPRRQRLTWAPLGYAHLGSEF